MKTLTPHDYELQQEINLRARIKYALAIAAFLIGVALTFTGCQTSAPTQQRVQTAAKLAAYIGTTEYLRVQPDKRPGFVLAVEALKQIESAPTVDLPTLLAVVNKLPTKELRSARAQMFITSATILLSDYGGQLPLDKLNELKPVAISIREGIELGLQ